MVITALTSGEYATGGSVGATVAGTSVGTAVCVGAWAGASVGTGVAAAPHAFNASASSTIRLKSTETFLDMGFFSFSKFES